MTIFYFLHLKWGDICPNLVFAMDFYYMDFLCTDFGEL